MSGVVGANAIPSREQYNKILKEYTEVLKGFPEFVEVQTSGSYNSDSNKTSFGDMDLIITLNAKDKKEIKKSLANYLLSTNKMNPFVSEKYAGKMYYNSGEIITVNFMDAQIDNIVALDKKEAKFKLNFLNLPAEKQGLLLGMMKTIFVENPCYIGKNKELAWNLSSKELQLREVEYFPGTLKEKTRKVLESYTDWNKVESLHSLDFNKSFDQLVQDINTTLKVQRSKERVKGIFKSMVTVKSGEQGKEKGLRKQRALDIVSNL